MISRDKVIQGMLDLFEAPAYLEIGVNKGVTFMAVEAAEKTAVDPKFRFDYRQYEKDCPQARCHELPSDGFFGSPEARSGYDVVYLDGLHTFDQTLRDLMNALALVKPGGVVIVDDVLPNSYRASLPNEADCVKLRLFSGETDKSWMGDVYRLVFFVHSYLQQYRYATVAGNHGQMILWRGRRTAGSFTEIPVGEVSTLPFASTILSRDLFNLMPYAEIVALAAADLGKPAAGGPR